MHFLFRSVCIPAKRMTCLPAASATFESVARQEKRQPFALEAASLMRLSENRNSIPRDVSSADEAVMETKQTGASCPWNVSTVPMNRIRSDTEKRILLSTTRIVAPNPERNCH